ncbi:MAG TPA: fibronectin type III domain-containing protein [Lentimicrobium sp.]|nr:fibronectin type III domain-containing protein [Lentimicrobium sp.]
MKLIVFTLFVWIVSASILNAQNLYTQPNAANIENEANTTTGWSGPATITSVTGNPQNGTYSLLITSNGNGARHSIYSFTAVVGTVYNVSIWARRGSNNSNSVFANWTGFQNFTSVSIASTQWTQYNFTLTASSTSPAIWVYASDGGPAGRTAYVDAITITAQAGDTQAPTAPTNLASSNVTATSLTLSWTASTDNIGVTNYRIYQNNTQVGQTGNSTTTFNVSGLTASTAYSYYVRAEDAAGNLSANSNTINVTTAVATDTQPPTVPTNLASSNVTATSLTLSWTASTDNIGVTNYRIYQNNTQVGQTGNSTTTFNVTGLTASTAYSYYVRAEDAAGNLSANSNTINVTTAAATDTQPPTAPTNLASSNVTATSLTLSWTASTDNIGVTNYRIYQNNTQAGQTGNSTTTFNVTGLTASTTYSYYVRAEDAAGNLSANSNTQTVTTASGGGGGGTAYTTENANLPTVNWQSLNLYVAGRMGIGTQPNSAYLLSANGTVRTKDLVVQPGWSDFVFEPGYDLPDLKKVEEYIIANGRLIDLPSAAEIQENGAKLGQTNALLLMKIEELTLYLIEMNKRLENLEGNIQISY